MKQKLSLKTRKMNSLRSWVFWLLAGAEQEMELASCLAQERLFLDVSVPTREQCCWQLSPRCHHHYYSHVSAISPDVTSHKLFSTQPLNTGGPPGDCVSAARSARSRCRCVVRRTNPPPTPVSVSTTLHNVHSQHARTAAPVFVRVFSFSFFI